MVLDTAAVAAEQVPPSMAARAGMAEQAVAAAVAVARR
jgi:hypothetical protein